jgi:hypothetical protein
MTTAPSASAVHPSGVSNSVGDAEAASALAPQDGTDRRRPPLASALAGGEAVAVEPVGYLAEAASPDAFADVGEALDRLVRAEAARAS